MWIITFPGSKHGSEVSSSRARLESKAWDMVNDPALPDVICYRLAWYPTLKIATTIGTRKMFPYSN